VARIGAFVKDYFSHRYLRRFDALKQAPAALRANAVRNTAITDRESALAIPVFADGAALGFRP
jgi:hypothetical protein